MILYCLLALHKYRECSKAKFKDWMSFASSWVNCACLGLLTWEFLNSEYSEKRTCRGWIQLLYTGMSTMATKKKQKCTGLLCSAWSVVGQPWTSHCLQLLGLCSPMTACISATSLPTEDNRKWSWLLRPESASESLLFNNSDRPAVHLCLQQWMVCRTRAELSWISKRAKCTYEDWVVLFFSYLSS